MTPKFIYFDIDNTLLNHSAAEESAQKEIYNTYPELQTVKQDEWLQAYKMMNHSLWLQYQKGKISREHLQFTRFAGTMKKLGITAGRSEEIGQHYMEQYRQHWTWVDGAEEAIEMLAGYFPVGFITNGFLETQQKKIEYMGLGRFSSRFIISEEIGVMKPHPKVFDAATERAGTVREQILYVGDSYSSDITGGRNAGWQTAWFTALIGEDEIAEGQTADFVFDRFPMLTNYLNGGA